MITTSTGAKKLESSDNWREIFPNPGTSAAGAHNASVDAQDRIQAEVAPIINGKRCSLGAASGDYVLLRNSTIAGKTDGAYVATKAIPANTDLDSTYLGSPITGGMVNELNSNITSLTKFRVISTTIPASAQPNANTLLFTESGLSNKYVPVSYSIKNGDWYSWFDGNVGSLMISGTNLYIWLTAGVLAGKDIKVVLLEH